MRKVAWITTNKVLAQSLAALIEGYQDLEFEPHLLLNPQQAALDAEVLGIDIAVVEMSGSTSGQIHAARQICEELRRTVPCCCILLLVQQDSQEARAMAMESVADGAADDYVFYDVSLDYLIAKLLSLPNTAR